MRHLPLSDPGEPDHRSPGLFLWWLARGQWRTLVAGMVLGTVWMLCQALMPAVIGRAIDFGVAAKDTGALLGWVALMLGIGVTQAAAGIMRHRFAVTNWLTAAYRTIQLVTRHSTRLGATLPKRVSTGEVAAIGTSDLSHLGNAMDVSARTAGAVVSFAVVAVLLLQTSITLGLLVLVGLPLCLGVLVPVMRPLQRRNLTQRSMMGELSNVAADIVGGLRVLRGIGGERVFHARYVRDSEKVRRAGVEVGRLQSLLDAAQVALPGLFVALVVWLGARLAVQGSISVGELVSFYGYAAFLMIPLRTAVEAISKFIRAFVSARRVCTVLALAPEAREPNDPLPAPPAPAAMVDVTSGVRIEPGLWSCLVSENPDSTSAIVDRLGGYSASAYGGQNPDVAEERLGEVRWGDVPLSQVSPAEIRRRIVVSDSASVLFSGSLRQALDVADTGADLGQALYAAAAEDVLDALPEGLQTTVTERGRSFSGGQRQRLVLARALALSPEVLLLVEPTSAVDAHTEARIGDRLPHLRRGSTTVATTSSPLLLDRCDRVLFVVDGHVVDAGTHRSLMAENPEYRAVVTREEISR